LFGRAAGQRAERFRVHIAVAVLTWTGPSSYQAIVNSLGRKGRQSAGGAMARTQRPLWRCPECGHRFVTKNLSHSCGNYRLADHFTGTPRSVRESFNRWVAVARNAG